MAIYAIGDIQGCLSALLRLVEKIKFDPEQDQLWLTGDLVNRGPDSLGVLRWVKEQGKSVVTVLGNHDLHLLAIAAGHSTQRRSDTLSEILNASDREELLSWLQHQPLLHHEAKIDTLMVHAGLPPQWNLDQARNAAYEVESVLRGENADSFFRIMYGNTPSIWDKNLHGLDRIRYITNALTRMRFCNKDGGLELKEKGPPGTQPKQLTPWFSHPYRAPLSTRIVFGHWSTLGYIDKHNVLGLDTGCLWGGKLTAARLDTPIVLLTQIKCKAAPRPAKTT